MHVNVLHDTRDNVRVRGRAGLLTAAMSRFVVVAFMRFPMAYREGVSGGLCDEPLLRFSAPEVDFP